MLVNTAGISGRRLGDGPVDECTEEAWDAVLDANLKSVFLCCKHAIPRLRAAGGGAIVNVSSVLGLVGGDEDFATHAYAASKAGIVGLSRAIAVHYAGDGIRCNVVAPGLIATPMSERAQGDERIRARLRRAAAAHRRLRLARGRRGRGALPRDGAVRDRRGAHRRRRLDGAMRRSDAPRPRPRRHGDQGRRARARRRDLSRGREARRRHALALDAGGDRRATGRGRAARSPRKWAASTRRASRSPASFDLGSGVAHFVTNLGGATWDGVPVRDPLRKALGVPTGLINDARAFGFAESRLGAARDCDTAAFFTLGTGVGGAVVVGRRLQLGYGCAGELGHTTVDGSPDAAVCGCGNPGCVEAYVRARGGRRGGRPRRPPRRSSRRRTRATPCALDALAEAGTLARRRDREHRARAQPGARRDRRRRRRGGRPRSSSPPARRCAGACASSPGRDRDRPRPSSATRRARSARRSGARRPRT